MLMSRVKTHVYIYLYINITAIKGFLCKLFTTSPGNNPSLFEMKFSYKIKGNHGKCCRALFLSFSSLLFFSSLLYLSLTFWINNLCIQHCKSNIPHFLPVDQTFTFLSCSFSPNSQHHEECPLIVQKKV